MNKYLLRAALSLPLAAVGFGSVSGLAQAVVFNTGDTLNLFGITGFTNLITSVPNNAVNVLFQPLSGTASTPAPVGQIADAGITGSANTGAFSVFNTGGFFSSGEGFVRSFNIDNPVSAASIGNISNITNNPSDPNSQYFFRERITVGGILTDYVQSINVASLDANTDIIPAGVSPLGNPLFNITFNNVPGTITDYSSGSAGETANVLYSLTGQFLEAISGDGTPGNPYVTTATSQSLTKIVIVQGVPEGSNVNTLLVVGGALFGLGLLKKTAVAKN